MARRLAFGRIDIAAGLERQRAPVLLPVGAQRIARRGLIEIVARAPRWRYRQRKLSGPSGASARISTSASPLSPLSEGPSDACTPNPIGERSGSSATNLACTSRYSAFQRLSILVFSAQFKAKRETVVHAILAR